jgi:hypothetical protein
MNSLKFNRQGRIRIDVIIQAQEQGELVIEAKVELGKLIADTPARKGERTDLAPQKSKVSKSSVYNDLKLTRKQADNYQLIANNLHAVEKAKAIAKENNDILTESLVLQVIKAEQTEKKRAEAWGMLYKIIVILVFRIYHK